MPKMNTFCFTGSRPKKLCGYNQDSYNGFVRDFVRYLYQFIDPSGQTKTQFISGGAQGFDQLAFWTVNLFRECLPKEAWQSIINTVYVPFKGQQSVWKETGLFSRQEYESMLSCADHVAWLNGALTDKKEVAAALMERNHKMVDASDKVIALYPDDSWDTASGGTAECMRYAASQGKPIIQIRYTIQNNILTADFT